MIDMFIGGNPNSCHTASEAARCEMEQVTESIADLLGVERSEIMSIYPNLYHVRQRGWRFG